MYNNIFIISSYQYPHLEHFFEDILFLAKNKKKVCVINLVPILSFRTCFYSNKFKRHLGTRILNSRINKRVRYIIGEIKKYSTLYFVPTNNLDTIKSSFELDKEANNLAIDFLRTFKKSYFVERDNVQILSKKIKISVKKFYNPLKEIIKKNKSAKYHIFSGRFPIERFIVDFMLKNKNIIFYECNDFNCNVLRKTCNTNLLNMYEDEINEILLKYNKSKLFNAVSELIKSKRKGKMKSKFKYDFVFYTTSLDEILSFGTIPDQIKILLKFAETFKANPKAAIRVHPNTRNKSKYDQGYWDFFEKYLRSFGITVISYKDNIDSYSLLHENSICFSVGSTITGELLFLNYKSFQIGDFMYFGKIIKNNTINPNLIYKKGFDIEFNFSNDYDAEKLVGALLIEYIRGESFQMKGANWMTKDAELVYKFLGIKSLDKLLPIGLRKIEL